MLTDCQRDTLRGGSTYSDNVDWLRHVEFVQDRTHIGQDASKSVWFHVCRRVGSRVAYLIRYNDSIALRAEEGYCETVAVPLFRTLSGHPPDGLWPVQSRGSRGSSIQRLEA